MCCVVLALATTALVADSVADPETADAHNKCENRYVRGITGYQEVKRHNRHGPYIQRVPVYGPVWTKVCGISHSHWWQRLVCASTAVVVTSTVSTGSGSPVAGGVAGVVTYEVCIKYVTD